MHYGTGSEQGFFSETQFNGYLRADGSRAAHRVRRSKKSIGNLLNFIDVRFFRPEEDEHRALRELVCELLVEVVVERISLPENDPHTVFRSYTPD